MAKEVNYDLILFENSDNYNEIKKALEITERFIKRKGLILVGGMAIDFALRLKESSLYDKYETPDYDCYSSDSYKDAQELGIELCKEGMSNVSIIYGLHLTTMRVRVNFIAVADITYIPPNIYEKIRTLEYKNFKIIHPYVQMIDQHRALSYPYEHLSFGGSVYRWQKDLDRNALLLMHYPIEHTGKGIKSSKHKIDAKLLHGQCIAGYAAYDVYMENFKPGSEWEFQHPISIFSSFFDDFIKKIDKNDKAKYFNRFLDRLPKGAQVGDITVYNNYGALIAANTLSDDGKFIENSETSCAKSEDPCDKFFITGKHIYVVSPQHVLMFLLHHEEYDKYNKLRELNLELTTFPYGTELMSDAQDNYYRTFDNLDVEKLPKRLYPKPEKENCLVESEFDYSSRYFQVDGEFIK